jgi:transketolase
MIGSGEDVALIALGGLAREAVRAAELLAQRDVEPTVAVVSTLNPAPIEDLSDLLHQVPVALSLEAHYLVGGLGSLVCEIAAENAPTCRVFRCGVDSVPRGRTGSPDSLNSLYGLTAAAIAQTAWEEIASLGERSRAGT